MRSLYEPFTPSAPKPAPKPKPKKVEEEPKQRTEGEEARRRAKTPGRRTTLLTGNQGAAPGNTQQSSLLGGGS
jgi:hypothetical protein